MTGDQTRMKECHRMLREAQECLMSAYSRMELRDDEIIKPLKDLVNHNMDTIKFFNKIEHKLWLLSTNKNGE